MIYTVTLNPALDRELTVPALTFDSVLRATAARVDWGGKGFNVSRVLAVLGGESIALGFAGGRTGEALREGLASLGIMTGFIPIAGETRTNVSIVTEDCAHHIKVNEGGPTISAEEQAALKALVQKRARSGDWWVLAGSLPPGIEPSFYAELIGDIKAAGGRVILDTSAEALKCGYAAQPYLIKPNALEISQLTGRPVNTVDEAIIAAGNLKGVEYIVVSMGRAGALLLHEGRGWFASAPAVQERNPIGAGDSLVAGLVWGFCQNSPTEALRWGVACGAATASRSGTDIGTYQEIAQLAQQIVVQEVYTLQ
ncbi:MAG TPA: 1-phosphofructokinase [Chloroflexia bacterium]|nr:1-phosphofructokinase [Chloroflexia bacterium]